ncbi:unnamed protein product [marine sediment metagenome]|uniref:Uncharacterized protein n=1 Tax=marine sediment metagenome TaxID=412755 RepID=X1T081_9ZZZZ
MGEVGTVTITPGAAWAWQSADWRKFWNYDSLFIWIKSMLAVPDIGYDEVAPYDAHSSDPTLEEWQRLNRRYFIRVIYDSETAGDVPVSGTINNIEIPTIGSSYEEEEKAVPADVETCLIDFTGAGFVSYIQAKIFANVGSAATEIRIYCDENLAFNQSFDHLNDLGVTATSPCVQLLKISADGICVVTFCMKFHFRRRFRLCMYNADDAQSVSAWVFPSLLG